MVTLAIFTFIRYFTEESSKADVIPSVTTHDAEKKSTIKASRSLQQTCATNAKKFQRLYLNLFSSIPASMFEVIYLAPSIDQIVQGRSVASGQCSGNWLAPMGRSHALGAAFYVYLHPGITLKHIDKQV